MSPLARFPLAVLPTPLVRAQRLEAACGGSRIWVKRDDLSGLSVAGNKARPLELLIGDALAQGADTFVAVGSAKSNFCAAAAVASRLAGMYCALLYAGEPADTVTVQLARAAGASITFDPTLDRSDLDRAVHEHAERLRAAGHRPYAVPRGGATATGAAGFALAARELAAQCEAQEIGPCTVVVPTGSGATQAGLVTGVVGHDLPLRVVGASVSRPVQQMRPTVLGLARECARLLGVSAAEETDIDVRDAVGPGFGIAAPADVDSAALALTHEGILLDDTYTAKAMTLVRELARTGEEPVVFWCTGGLPGALSALHTRVSAGASA